MSRPFWNSFLINFFTQYNGRKFVRNFSTAIAALKFFSSELKKKLFFVVALLLRHLKPLSNAHENFAGKDRWELFFCLQIFHGIFEFSDHLKWYFCRTWVRVKQAMATPTMKMNKQWTQWTPTTVISIRLKRCPHEVLGSLNPRKKRKTTI